MLSFSLRYGREDMESCLPFAAGEEIFKISRGTNGDARARGVYAPAVQKGIAIALIFYLLCRFESGNCDCITFDADGFDDSAVLPFDCHAGACCPDCAL